MELKYLQPVTGSELEAACNDPVNNKLAKHIRKHYVFADKCDFPKKPGKMATRAIWENYEKNKRDVQREKDRLHELKDKGIFTLYRQNTYVVSVDNNKYFILSGNNEKEPVSIEDVRSSDAPRQYAGRRVQGNKTCMFVPFCGGMYTVSMLTGYYRRIN